MVKKGKDRHSYVILFFTILLFAGCANRQTPSAVHTHASEVPISQASSVVIVHEVVPIPPVPLSMMEQVTKDIVTEIQHTAKNDMDKIKLAYDYVITNSWFDEPLGLDTWQYTAVENEPLDYLENRAYSLLKYKVGMCEDYAAALCILLEEMGFKTQYLPGLVISVGGGYVDHAWSAVEYQGQWYHLDPQLEQNVMKKQTNQYRFFMKNDEYMRNDHIWGYSLIDYKGITLAQQKEIRANHMLPTSTAYIETPRPQTLPVINRPDITRIKEDIEEEKRIFIEENGEIVLVPLDFIPPVFGLDGFGDPRY